ncbi:MAG: endonuclease III [Candidatus Eremiobacteraeota bacterium]|nr:endonuclease III [Candidatus Eremiobacteraeota bacterium]MCW5869427.1 endonuclease III [Candidatus Eremiobacteraeota bacterium]
MSKNRASEILKRLRASIPNPAVELKHSSPFELVIATILSAQCTDERVNQVTPLLFQRWPDPTALAQALPEEVEEVVRPTGFYRNKAKSIQACSRHLVERFRSTVPETMEELTSLPGVGRKTANLILGECFGKPGIIVDTHVGRVARRLQLTAKQEAEEVEKDLQKLLPKKDWSQGSSRLLLHGRYVCLAKKPRCPDCCLASLCPSAFSPGVLPPH